MSQESAQSRRLLPDPGGASFRMQLSRAMFLVLLIALLPSIIAFDYLRSIEQADRPVREATVRPDAEAPPPTAPDEARPPTGSDEASDRDTPAPAPDPASSFTPPERAARNTITFGLIAFLAGALVVVYTPIHLLKALSRLTAILKQAESGNLNVAVAGSQVREVSQLAVAVNRTLGRLRHFDELKTRRIREEQRLVEALLASGPGPLALVSPQARIARRNKGFRELVENGEGDCSGRSVRELMGDDVHEAVRRVQRDREVVTLDWTGGSDRTYRLTLRPVKDEVDAPPRILVICEARNASGDDASGESTG